MKMALILWLVVITLVVEVSCNRGELGGSMIIISKEKSQIEARRELETNLKSAHSHSRLMEKEFSSDPAAAVVVADTVVNLPDEWKVIGPFAYGMREEGADPLAQYGGSNSDFPTFSSELAEFGQVPWTTWRGTNITTTVGPIFFGTNGTGNNPLISVPWQWNRNFYGWALNQWQGWAIGQLNVPQPPSGFDNVYMVTCSNIGEYYLDGVRFRGDWYGYGNHWQKVTLTPGIHEMKVRLGSSIRIFGGGIPPTVTFVCNFQFPDREELTYLPQESIIPDVVSGKIAGEYMSLTFMNGLDRWVYISSLASVPDSPISVRMVSDIRHYFASGQIRNVPLRVVAMRDLSDEACPIKVTVNVTIDGTSTAPIDIQFRCGLWGQTYLFTFLDFDSSVHYAAAKPPISDCPSSGCPIITTLHGAGVEASSPAWTEAYDRQQHSWILYPTGRTPWGYDWHGPSRKNVFNALNYLTNYLPGVPDTRTSYSKINSKKIFMAGHSNGGQGCWYMVSHFPDSALAANAAAGYLKIQLYVPYFWRNGDTHADPILRGILESAISEFDTDLYISNIVGIPVLGRVGAMDDNVPAIHTKRIVRLINEYSRNPYAANLSEVPGEGHWFNDIMRGEPVQSFINHYTDPNTGVRQALPEFPSSFVITTLNPGSSGSKGSITILQLRIPYRLGRIHVDTSGGSVWTLRTENVNRFTFSADDRRRATAFTVDGMTFSSVALSPTTYCLVDLKWRVCTDSDWILSERSPDTYGPIFQIYEQPILIIAGTRGGPSETAEYFKISTEISNVIYSYGRGYVEIMLDVEFDSYPNTETFNLILLGGPESNSVAAALETVSPVKFDGTSFAVGERWFTSPSTGIMFLLPWQTKLALLITGTDLEGLKNVMTVFPVQTGNTIPDYVVVDSEVHWKGVGGALAAGFWSNAWTFDYAMGYLR